MAIVWLYQGYKPHQPGQRLWGGGPAEPMQIDADQLDDVQMDADQPDEGQLGAGEPMEDGP
jgi:hypothetical protein